MANRKMTFTIPDDLAAQLIRRVPARSRSRFVAESLARHLRERDERILRSCEVANRHADVGAIEDDWEGLQDKADFIEEPWNGSTTR